MKLLAGSFALAALMAAGIVAAQTNSSPPSTSYPSTSPSTSTSSSSGMNSSSQSSSAGKSHKQQMKDCVASEQANHPNESKSDAKKTCKSQMENSPQQ